MRLLALFVLSLVGAGPAFAKDCRVPHLPRGQEIRLPPGCEETAGALRSKPQGQERLRGEAGFVDLGNGTSVRIGGRVRAEMGFRR